jgi:two-component system LytT family sensor kinase
LIALSDVYQNRNYQFYILQTLGWTGWVTLFGLRDAYWGQPYERLLLLLVDALAGFLLTTGLRYIYRSVWEAPVYQRVMTVIVASYVMAAIWQPVKNFSQFYYFQDFEMVETYGHMGYFSGIIGYSYFLMLGWSGLYFALKFYRLLQSEIERSIRAESLAHESQLRMLRYQLNPHFLFNTLNAISTLILEKNTDSANAMVSKLSNFLRYSLDQDVMQKVDLEHEISTMKLYLEIEQVRFEERLRVETIVEEEAGHALVPSLILQPLVENSIKYAVANREDGGTISIQARREGEQLVLVVADDGPGIERVNGVIPEFTGVGLANTQDRLQQLFGPSHSCEFGESEPHGLRIVIRIPFERAA